MTAAAPLLRDLVEIPTSVQKSDFVISLAQGITDVERTVGTYVVTEQLVTAFDQALSLVGSAIGDRRSKGAYLHGSFGSGKSHFMAVLHLLLQQHPAARSVPELAPVVAKHDARLAGTKTLLVPYHFVGKPSMEAGVLGGYVDHIARIHRDARMPAVFADDKLFADAVRMRTSIGDERFFAGLGGGRTRRRCRSARGGVGGGGDDGARLGASLGRAGGVVAGAVHAGGGVAGRDVGADRPARVAVGGLVGGGRGGGGRGRAAVAGDGRCGGSLRKSRAGDCCATPARPFRRRGRRAASRLVTVITSWEAGMEDERRREVGLFRYALIREAADAALRPSERGLLVRQLSLRDHVGVDRRRVALTPTVRNPYTARAAAPFGPWGEGGEEVPALPRRGLGGFQLGDDLVAGRVVGHVKAA
ncbi:MAG: hypothetical protein ACR2KP_07940 [Egibacteraceae bacterium]